MSEHFDSVTLKDIAKHFSYHPNYVSTLLHRELGKSFSEILSTVILGMEEFFPPLKSLPSSYCFLLNFVLGEASFFFPSW